MLEDGCSVVGDDDLTLGGLDLFGRSSNQADCLQQPVLPPARASRARRTILSMPLGPSDVRTASLTALAAVMLESRTSWL